MFGHNVRHTRKALRDENCNSQPLACRVCRCQNPANVRKRFFSGNESHLSRLNLHDATANLSNLCLRDVRWNVAGKALHNAIGELGTLLCRKLFRFFENLGDSLSHKIKIHVKLRPIKHEKMQPTELPAEIY